MKNPIRIKRKRLKARIRKNDFVKKRNIRRNNQSTPTIKEVIALVQPARDTNGRIIFETITIQTKNVNTPKKYTKAKYVITGEKMVTRKLHKSLLSPGDGILPKKVKPREKKKDQKIN